MDWYDIIATSQRERGPLRARLGATGFDRAYAAGARMSRGNALEEALRYTPPCVVPNPEPSGQLVDLSAREREVLVHMANGLSNQQIADMLVISPKTVERHRANLLAKLGLRDRLELTRYAIRVGLIEP